MNSTLHNLAGPDKRNIAEYEGHLDVTERLVLDLIEACDAVRSALE